MVELTHPKATKRLDPISQLSPRERDFIESQGVDINKLNLIKNNKPARDILSSLTPGHQKDVLSKVDRPTSKVSTSSPILLSTSQGNEILDGSHALAGALKNNGNLDFYIHTDSN